MAAKYYVYELIDPRTGATFYVGKGAGRRIGVHEREAKSRVTHPKHERIREIWADGLEVRRNIVKRFAREAAAYEFERELIAHYGQANLCNIHSGGPIEFAPKTEAQRDAESIRALAVIAAKTDGFRVELAHWWYGGRWHPLTKDKIGAFARNFKGLVDKHGVDWATKALATA